MIKDDYLIATVKDGFLRTDDGKCVVTLDRNLYKDVTSKLKEGDVVKIENYWDHWSINATNEEILKGRCITFTVENNIEEVKEETSNYNNDEGDVSDANNGDSESN